MKTFWDFMSEQEQDDNSINEDESSDAISKDRDEILDHISSYVTNTLRDKVAFILNCYPETRDSDIALQLKFWETFETHLYNGVSIPSQDLFKLTKLTSISRERARLQNKYRLFLASPEIRKQRGTLSEEEKVKAVEDRPNYPLFIVYMDESGKNDEYLIIGSVWFLAEYPTIYRSIQEVRERHNFQGEFHFTKMNESELPIYKDLIDTFVINANVISFKLISVKRSGLKRNIHDLLKDLYYHLLIRGIEHEDKSGRAPLPRTLQVWIDQEEEQQDRLLIANLQERLKESSITRFANKLRISDLRPMTSKKNNLLQIADLFSSSANRIINQPGQKITYKDEFAQYMMKKLNITLTTKGTEQYNDMAIHISV